jgi:hypothetical protein
MKKILLVLGMFATLSFTSCTKSDCDCSLDNGYKFDVKNFEGDCEAIDWDEIPVYEQGYGTVGDISVKCTER